MHPGSAGQFEAARDTPDDMGAGREIRRAGRRPDVGQAQARGQVVTQEQYPGLGRFAQDRWSRRWPALKLRFHFLDVSPDRRVVGADFLRYGAGRL
jgi:hypothetical protein